MTRTPKGAWPILLPAAGFTVWAAAFLLLYGAQAVGCRLEWDRVDLFGAFSIQRLLQIILYLTALAGIAMTWRWLRRQTGRLERDTAAYTFLMSLSSHGALAAFGAVAFCFAGVFWLTTC